MKMSSRLQATAALPPGKEPLVPVGQETRWAPGGKFSAPTGTWTPYHPGRSPGS